MPKLNKADLLNYLLDRANKLQDRAAIWKGADDVRAAEARAGRLELLDAWALGSGGNFADAVLAAHHRREEA